ncbi:Proteasome lid subunit RPN8/RPN11, contains Jab1/MPN metalloenzyme (JAMM) motif [Altererythrobacter xiamenensis]|uniref:Proteasome lid subunit RPN8/RPN11, contains Jab1/MPN metalloenzyme (JAMM) motif n=1 Tax=Altererythrobacter xiamenensis TaxID=1316679 RepID=A0A1Y6EIN3_9SPHN|nr:M67 family metallopeptidase [Altererythrobacter xiamenensis]SMQ62485.1 Proteasome lid subunit RPN8/RPN11, contains Jab1/MPN metalloenzyme (JAMM) motif [Altererythrobacter xiamenensis]
MHIEVTRDVIEALRAEARAAHPRECCGIMLGTAERVDALAPAANVHPAPDRHFEIDPQALIDAHRAARKGGPEVIGYYHSHPVGEAVPSSTDRAMASGDGRIWAIIAGEDVKFWRDMPDGFEVLSCQFAED